MNLAESLLHAFAAHGACQNFGNPGDFAPPFFRVAEASGILPLYTLSHEPAIAFPAAAAIAHARATRGRFQLIEAMIPRGVMSSTLARFVAGVRRLHGLPA
jgi:hypothetical protein